MRKMFKLFAALIFPVLICLAHTVKAQLSTAEQKERCQNNKIRLAELEVQSRVINADLSASMTKKEMEAARTQMIFVRSMKNDNNLHDWARYDHIAAQYNYDTKPCHTVSITKCATDLEKIIGSRIDKAMSLNRPTLLAKKKDIDQQIARHRTNLIALGCDDLSGACNLKGSWRQDTPGIGSTVWEIKSDGTANETGIGYAKGKATLSGNVLHIDWNTATGYSGYYEWTLDENCSSGKGTLVFKTGRTDSLNSTVKRD